MNTQRNIIKRVFNYLIRKEKERRLSRKWASTESDFLKNNYQKLLAMKNQHKNQPCYVIGNGPSINKLDLNLLFVVEEKIFFIQRSKT